MPELKNVLRDPLTLLTLRFTASFMCSMGAGLSDEETKVAVMACGSRDES